MLKKIFCLFIFCNSHCMEISKQVLNKKNRDTIEVGIIGDFNPELVSHLKTNAAIEHAAHVLELKPTINWMGTKHLEDNPDVLSNFDAIICSPGSPYKSMVGALNGIQVAREKNIPFIATCGGFQHVVIEYARNVLRIADAEHAEYNSDASNLFITPAACSLRGKKMALKIMQDSRSFASYQKEAVEEEYYCNFIINPEHENLLDTNGLHIVGKDDAGSARILELKKHRFFIATLFVPQARSTDSNPHPLFVELLRAIK